MRPAEIPRCRASPAAQPNLRSERLQRRLEAAHRIAVLVFQDRIDAVELRLERVGASLVDDAGVLEGDDDRLRRHRGLFRGVVVAVFAARGIGFDVAENRLETAFVEAMLRYAR